MRLGSTVLRVILGVLVLAGLSACASSPQSRFYTLNPMAAQDGTHSPGAKSSVSITVLPVDLPDYLDRPEIVTRYGQNQLKFATFDRWAGSLGDNIAMVLAENLGVLLGTDQVFPNGGSNRKTDYSVAARVLRLDCVPGRHVLLKTQWTVSAGQKEIATGVSDISEFLPDNRYESIAAALSKALGQVSRDIAERIMER